MGILQFWFYFTNLAEEWAPWPSTQVVPSPWPPHAPDLLWLMWYLTVLSSATSIHPPHFYVLWQPSAPVLSLLVSALSASALLQLLVLSLFCKKNHAGSKIQLLFIVLQEINSYAAFQCSRDVTYRFKGNHGIVFPCLHPSSPSLIFISSLPWNSLHPHFFL